MTDEESKDKVYIFLDLSDCKNVPNPVPGDKIELKVQLILRIYLAMLHDTACFSESAPATEASFIVQDLNTNQPKISVANSCVLSGRYKDTLGSQIFLEESTTGQRTSDSELQGVFPQIIGITDKAIVLKEVTEVKGTTKPAATSQ